MDVAKFQCIGGDVSKNRLASRRRRETWELCCGCAHLALALQNAGCRSHASDISYAVQNSSVRFEIQDLVDDAMVLFFRRILRRGRVLYINIGVV